MGRTTSIPVNFLSMLTPPSGGKAWLTMYSGQVVFAQLMELLPRHEFDTCVKRYDGEYGVRGFSCRDQFLCMAYAQLTYRESLRDIETCLRSHQPKLYHAGFRSGSPGARLPMPIGCDDWRSMPISLRY